MAMSDPIADLLTRIRNGLRVGKEYVYVPASRMKEDICRVLSEEGFISSYTVAGEGVDRSIRIELRYTEDGEPVMVELHRVSKPSLRVYAQRQAIRPVRNGMGITILTTSQGIMTGKQARDRKIGGEVLCEIW